MVKQGVYLIGCNSDWTLGIQRYLNAEGFNAGASDGTFDVIKIKFYSF